MKSYLTEADTTAAIAQPVCTSRQPFKLLQNLHHYHDSLRLKMAASSSALKSIANRQKRTDPSSHVSAKTSKITESASQASRNRASSISTRQKNILNARSNTKTAAASSKKADMPVDAKSKITTGINGSSVGSLTSSPKWSHIKNKFENGTSVEKTKLGRTTSLTTEESEVNKLQSTSKSLTSLVTETKLSVNRTKVVHGKKDTEKIGIAPFQKSSLSTSKVKVLDDRNRSDCTSLKDIGQKDKSGSRSNSPKNSHLGTVKNSGTNLRSSKISHLNIPMVKLSVPLAGNSSKNSQLQKTLASSSVSLSSNSSKNSEVDDTQSISSMVSCNSSKNSLLNIPAACSAELNTLSSPKSSSLNIPLGNSPKSTHSPVFSANASTLHSKKTSQVNKTNACRTNKKTEDRTFGQSNNQNEQTQRKSLFSDKDRILLNNISNINKSCKISASSTKPNLTVPSNGVIKQNSVTDNVEKIQDLVKCSQPSSKTVWVKDNVGNWVKKTDTESKTAAQSKVADLRTKFLETGKDPVLPLSKSITANNIPSKITSKASRPLAKSSTTSSICDKALIDDLNRTFEGKTRKKSNSENSKSTDSKTSASNKRNSVDSNAKLNIVQRAILSYEGNLTLLSPETQRRLRLVNEKVRAQTDDDKILKAKVQQDDPRCNMNARSEEVSIKKPSQKQLSSQKIADEPILPTRDFLQRYRQMNKDTKKPSKANPQETQVDQKAAITANSGKENGKKPIKLEVFKTVADASNSDVGQNRQDLILNLSGNQLSLKTSESNSNNGLLLPNSSFLWRRSTTTSSELSKSSTTSSVSLTSSDYRNYYDVQNYYSTLDLEIEKRSEISEEPIYIDSQESNSSENNYASSNGPYENILTREDLGNRKTDSYEEWTDISDDDYIRSSLSNNQRSTLKRRKNKRHSSHRDNQYSEDGIQNPNEPKSQHLNDTISFTDSSDTLINDEIQNESTFDLSDANHFYEPVYESLGNYLRNQEEPEDDNCSLSLSPDDRDNGDFLHSSLTSLESAESTKQDKDENIAPSKDTDKTDNKKSSNNKISQLKRHLSWTKNDIRLELSSKFNKIKIKKNGQNSTEIGVKVQEHGSVNTSPKKKTFIKCILRQKSSSSIPVKRSPSPKKESSLFYVHLTMGQEKQRPFSDSAIPNDASKTVEQTAPSKPLRQPEPSLQFNTKCGQQRPRFRKVKAGPTIQRPKTPPPLPPTSASTKSDGSTVSGEGEKINGSASEATHSHFYTYLDSDDFKLDDVVDSIYNGNDVFTTSCIEKNRKSNFSSKEDLTQEKKSITSLNGSPSSMFRKKLEDLSLPPFSLIQSELLKSPFEEEPMYQFYQKDAQQRATLWFSAVDGSESDFEDDASSKYSDVDYQPLSKPPVLQSQLSAMDLVHGEGGLRTLWCEVPEVIESGILKTISSKERKIQEAMFEVITSEASYLKSLNFLFDHFVQCSEFSGSETNILDKREKHILFSDIKPVRDVSARLLADLEKRWLENIVVSNICDIIYHHASKYFSVYVKYCSNQLYQERLLRELKEKRPEFVAVIKRLESNPVCQSLDMHSFLMLPMQRITRLPLLIDAIFHRLSADSPIYESCKMALASANKLVAECNEGARKMERMEEMLVISQQLDFSDCKGLGLLSASRWLVKKGELVQLLLDNTSRRTFGRSSRWCKIQLYFFLFTDLLVVTRKKSDDSYSVVDFCPRNMLQVLSVDENMPPLPMRLPSSYRNLFQIIMLNNKEGKTVEMLLSCLLESDRTRWMDAMTPVKSENPDEKIYEEWDWPQFQCTHAYNAQQPDELSLEEADVVNVFRKMADGWFEGERIRDGVRGWFPSSHAVEIITSHVRARNLHQRYRLLMLSQTYLEEQCKAQALLSKK